MVHVIIIIPQYCIDCSYIACIINDHYNPVINQSLYLFITFCPCIHQSRYAMKRMRRKFKAMQRDINGRAVDWRTLYMESKEKEAADMKDTKKKNKKLRDKNAEKRDKEQKKRYGIAM